MKAKPKRPARTYPGFCKADADRAAYDIARAGNWESWVRRTADLRAIENGCYFSIEHALYVRSFFENYFYTQPGVKLRLLDWQWLDVIGPIFGWRRKDGKRRFREAYVEIPKGNGKSFLCSGIALFMMIGDGRYGAETYCAAVDSKQAETVFKEAAKYVANSPVLRTRLRVISSTKRIIQTGKLGVAVNMMRALSKESGAAEGLKAHALVNDELHRWRDRDFFGALRYATTKWDLSQNHDSPLMISITTAGGDRKGVGWEEHEKARKYVENIVIDGYEDYYAVIYAAPNDADIYDPAVWAACNPSLGKSLEVEEMRSASRKAKDSKAEEIMFRRYRLNQWVQGSVDSWLPMKEWMECRPRLSPQELLGRKCWGGLDLSSTSDLTAFVLAFPDEKGFHILPFIWCPEDRVIERTQRENVPYQTWVDMKLIETTPGNRVDYEFIQMRIGEIAKQYDIQDIGIDMGWQGEATLQILMKNGLNMVPFEQTIQVMSPAAKAFEILVATRELRHDGNPVLQWAAANCVAYTDINGNVKPHKKKSADKIDPIIAAIMAVYRATSYGDSYSQALEDRGLLVLD